MNWSGCLAPIFQKSRFTESAISKLHIYLKVVCEMFRVTHWITNQVIVCNQQWHLFNVMMININLCQMFQACDPYNHQCDDGLETKSAELYLCLVVCETFKRSGNKISRTLPLFSCTWNVQEVWKQNQQNFTSVWLCVKCSRWPTEWPFRWWFVNKISSDIFSVSVWYRLCQMLQVTHRIRWWR